MTNEGLAILIPALVLGALFFIPIIIWAFGLWVGPRNCGYGEDELGDVPPPEKPRETTPSAILEKPSVRSTGSGALLSDSSTSEASVHAKREWRRAQLARDEEEAVRGRRAEDERITQAVALDMQNAITHAFSASKEEGYTPSTSERSSFEASHTSSLLSSYETPSSSHSSWSSDSPHSSHSTDWGSSSHSASSDHSSYSSYSDHSSSSYSSSSYDSGSSYSSSDRSSSSSSGWD